MSQSLQMTMNDIRPLLTSARLLRQSLESERQIAAEKSVAARSAKLFVDLWLVQRNSALQHLRDQQAQSIVAQQALADEARDLRSLLAKIVNSPGHVGAGIPTNPAQIPDGIRPFPSLKDGLTPPVAGDIIVRFGEQIDTDRQGITLKTAAGALVTAPYDGRIVFSGQFRSYGTVLIIEHRGLYHSVLAGLDRVDVVPDQWVLAGEPIGSLPADGKFGMLYFELRRNQKPIDPAPWLRAKLASLP
jgi:murein DD-endopeptidase MepM/ murein hydrolase activator NlpD